MSDTVNTKLKLIELMESLGAKPQAQGDCVIWELDSKNIKPQAQANKPQAQEEK